MLTARPPKTRRSRRAKNGNRVVLPGDGRVLTPNFVVKTMQLPPLTLQQKYTITNFANNTVPVYGSAAFTIAQLPDIGSLTPLFDKYKILSVEVYFVPYLATEVVATVPIAVPRLHTVVDQDDNTIPASIGELEQYSTYVEVRGSAPLVRKFKPRALMAIYQSAIATGYAIAPDVWLDLANDTIPHYGIKYAIGSMGNPNTFGYEIQVLMTATFTNVR